MQSELKAAMKSFVLGVMPDKPLQYLKKLHYLRSVRDIGEGVESDLQVVRHLVDPGDRVIDVGANIGVYTRFLSHLVGPQGMVYSVEPVPMTFEILSYIVRKEKLNNVRLLQCAVAGQDGLLTMVVPTHSGGGENFYRAKVLTDGTLRPPLRHFQVECRTLDSLLRADDKVRFAKVDVEGYELPVILGGQKLVGSSRPALLIEITDGCDPGSHGNEIIKLLGQYGYSPFWFDGTRLNASLSDNQVTNYFFLTNDQMDRVRRRAPFLVPVGTRSQQSSLHLP